MTTISQPSRCYTNSIDVDVSSLTLTQEQIDALSSITISNGGSGYCTFTSGGGLTIGGSSGAGGSGSYCYTIPSNCWGASGTISSTASVCIPSIDISSIYGVEWQTKFPEWNRIQNMIEEYPGLKIAFEKFKTVYELVKDDYDTPKDQRVRP